MKTVCIYHSIDLDGWMSAAIVKHWFIKNNKNYSIKDISSQKELIEKEKLSIGFAIIDNYNDDPIEFLDFIGYNYGQPIPDLSKYDKVIMCDVSFPENEMYKLCITKDFIWNDHHVSALNMYENIRPTLPNDIYYTKGLRGIQYAACELTWKYFFPNEPVPEIVRLLGRYDCFGHKGTDEEQKVLEFQYGARQCISNYEEAYSWLMTSINSITNKESSTAKSNIEFILDKGKSIYQYLCTEAKQVYKNGFEIKLFTYTDEDHMNPHKFICINKERFNPINFGLKYHEDGYDGCACFYLNKDKQWSFSLYNDNGNVDCSAIAKQFGGGGHRSATGMILNNEQFNNFIK